MSNCGVYVIRNKATGTRYFGSSKRLRARLRDHRTDLVAGRHANPPLQAAWNKYGPGAFEFLVIELTTSRDAALAREQFYMDHVLDKYNITFLAHSPARRGYKPSRLAVERASAARRGKPLSPEHKAAFMAGQDRVRANRPEGYFEKWREKMSAWWDALGVSEKAWLISGRSTQRLATKIGLPVVTVRCESKEDAERLITQMGWDRTNVLMRPLVPPEGHRTRQEVKETMAWVKRIVHAHSASN